MKGFSFTKLTEHVDAELKRRYAEKLSECVMENLDTALLSLVCVIMDGTHFVTREAIQEELQASNVTIPDEVIDKHLAKWRSKPLLPVTGILQI